ncbi:FAD dependent oxidoreductase [Nemania sp. NC0429]|nr:FAD dependent oxidoreductase [Nemania sp. NC0429]
MVKVPLPFPVPHATVPFWRTELHKLDSHRSTPDLPHKQDIIIIGAGFAGAALAYYLSKNTSAHKPSITVLEAREACSGATGRNGGQLRPDIFNGAASRMKQHGLEVANEVARFELENTKVLTDLIKSEGIDCDFTPVVSGAAFVDEAQAADAKILWDDMLRKGSPALKNVTYYGPEDAERISGARGAVALYAFSSAVIWPYKMVMHLLEAAVEAGINLQTHTMVHAVSPEADSEGYWTLNTTRGAVKARRIVFASNGYTGGLLAEYADAISPSRGTCARVKATAVGGPLPQLSSCGVVVKSPNTMDSYWGARPDGSFIVGGAGSYRDKPELWKGNFDDASLIEPAVPFFEQWASKNLVGWEDSETKVENVWTGIMGYTSDDLPHVGPVPGKTGLYICAGFIGHGMPNVLLSAKAIAKLLTDGSPLTESGVPACYETCLERLRKARLDHH